MGTLRTFALHGAMHSLMIVWLLDIAVFTSVASQGRSPLPRDVTRLAPSVYVVSAEAGNMVLLAGKDSSFIAGVQTPQSVAKVRELVTSLQAGPVRFVLVMPGDSSAIFGDGGWTEGGALVMVHENLRWRMQEVFQRSSAPSAGERPVHLPSLGFSDVVQIYMNGEEIHAVHQRGYSDADLSVHFERSNVLYLGNTFTADGYPSIDTTHHGSVGGIIETVKKFLTFPDSLQVIPGRGPIQRIPDLRSYCNMLIAIRDRVQQLASMAESAEEIVAARPTAPFDARWGQGPIKPDQFVLALLRSLAKH